MTILCIEKLSHCYHGYLGLFIVHILIFEIVTNTLKTMYHQLVTHEDFR